MVVVPFPNADMKTYKPRPALVVQDHTVPTGLQQKVVICITTKDRRGPTRMRVRANSPEGLQMGLPADSTMVADNIATVPEWAIQRTLGTCPVMTDVNLLLRRALGIS